MNMSVVLPSPVVIHAPSGSSQLPIVELDRARVEAERVRIRLKKGSRERASADCSFGQFQQQLKIDAWPFFHAAKKTELTRVLNANHVQNSARVTISVPSGSEIGPPKVHGPASVVVRNDITRLLDGHMPIGAMEVEFEMTTTGGGKVTFEVPVTFPGSSEPGVQEVTFLVE